MPAVAHNMTTTQFDLAGFAVVRSLGVVLGASIRSISVLGTVVSQCERSRADALDRMLQHAGELGANAVVGIRYDSAAVTPSEAEILAYGTAMVVELKSG